MKSFVKKTLLASLTLFASAGLLVACGGGEEEPSESTDVLNFVAVSTSGWDVDTTVGTHTYKFALNLKQDQTLEFKAVCTGEAQQGGQGGFPGGPGGGGFPGFGAYKGSVNANAEAPVDGEGEGEGEAEEETPVDYSEFDFSYTGTWSEETGYGYIINYNNKTIHVDYIKNQGRHQFYDIVSTDEGNATVWFQARDSEYRSKLASDYKVWDERDSTYIFTGTTTGNNGSIAFAYLYCHSDGSVVFNTASGADRKITLGLTWSLSNIVLSIVDGDTTYTADNSINTAHPGYRLNYSSIAFFCSTSSSVTWEEMTHGDFDGATKYQFVGSYTTSGPDGGTKNVEMNCTVNDTVFIYSSNSLMKKGTYTFDEVADQFTFNFEGEDPATSTKDGNSYVYSFQIVIQSFFGTSTIDVTLTYTPEA